MFDEWGAIAAPRGDMPPSSIQDLFLIPPKFEEKMLVVGDSSKIVNRIKIIKLMDVFYVPVIVSSYYSLNYNYLISRTIKTIITTYFRGGWE